MNFDTVDERLDLDNQLKEIAENFPKNHDDYFFCIRGKKSTLENFTALVGSDKSFCFSLFNIARNSEHETTTDTIQ